VDLEQLAGQIIECRKCPRLVAWRETVALEKRKAYSSWQYWGKPVPGFGDPHARILVVGLAPGAHGSNRTGRQFTGDASGGFLYPALYRAGFANQPDSVTRDDGLMLHRLYITAAGRCAPPGNRPTRDELANCQPYLEHEIELMRPQVIVCLGRVAFESILRVFSIRRALVEFGHGALHKLSVNVLGTGALHSYPWLVDSDHWLLCSYHPSQQNTSTRKLTLKMFDQIWARAKELSQDV
jgi:uracil-DNA glycosylase family 4